MALIDLTAPQPQPSAEHTCPLRETILVDADQGGRMVRHDGHARLHDGATMAFVREARRATVQQTGHDAFDDRSAVPPGTRQVHLGGGSYVVQVRLVQDLEHVLRCRRRGAGIDRLRDPHREHPPLMHCLPQGDVRQRHIASQRVDGRGGARPDPGDRLLYFVDQGRHVTGITRIPHGQMPGKDQARRRFGNHARLAAERRGAMAFALAKRRNRGIVRVDNVAVGPHLALRQPAGLVCDPLMGREGGGKLGVQARPLVLRQLWHTVQALLHGPSQGQDLASTRQQLRLGLAYQRHKHVAPPSTLPAEAAHHLLEVVLQVLRVRLPRRALGGARRGYGRDHLEDVFWGLIPRRRIIDTLAALLTGKGIDHHVGRADQTVLHRGRRLDRQPCRHQRFIEATAKLGEHFREHTMVLGSIHLDRGDPTGIHHGEVGPQPATDLFIGAGQLMLQELQRPSHPGRDGRTSPRGGLRKTLGERAVHGCDQGRPRNGIGPLANGMRLGDEVCHLQARASARQPMLEISSERHGRLS